MSFDGKTSITVPLTNPGHDVNLQEMCVCPLEAHYSNCPELPWNKIEESKMDGQTLLTGTKKDEGKSRMDLLSSVALYEVSKVMTFGCKKYAANNWRLGIAWSRVIGAALRHIFSWLGGEDKDPETGLSHLAHASCCLMFLLEYEQTHQELDDRYKGLRPEANQGQIASASQYLNSIKAVE